ncbi:oxidoreductase, partial [Mycolicibacterium elephantis]
DSPSENELGITYRDPQETLADTVSGLRRLGRV